MATLAAEFKESDAFDTTESLVASVVLSEEPWTVLRERLQPMGICLADTCSGDLPNIMRRLHHCKTCGEALRVFPSAVGGPPPLMQVMWDQDMAAAKRAWGVEYVASEAVLDLVANQLEHYSSQWDMHHWYAPLVALVQSSGWGKSRLMCQLWRKGFFVFYISCMGEKQTGFPRRTAKLADILQSARPTEATFVALVLGILTVLNKHAGDMTCQQWIQAQEKDTGILEEVHAVYMQELVKLPEEGDRAVLESQFLLSFKEEIQKLEEREAKLILCVDEAGELGENFVTFRRSLRSIPQGKSFFSVVLGTDRKVADLAAAAEDDASARVRLATPFKVYHPLYLIGKSDIFARAATDLSQTSTAPEDAIRYGRPLWAAFYDASQEGNKLASTIQLGMMKLLGKNIDTSEAGWVTRDVAVAVFACLVGLDVVAWGSLPQQLVAKHMRTIVNISKDRRRVYTAAAVEPVLAAAAAKVLHAADDAFLGAFLDRLIEVFLDGLVLEGVRGEVVIRIIIMLAMHECTKSRHYIQPVTLATFLETMFGKSTVDELKKNRCDLDGSLFFNSFTPISAEPFEQLVEEAFARCTALVARRNETVLDFALPIRLTPSDGLRRRPMQSTVLAALKNQETKGVAVIGQVKNRRSGQEMKSVIEGLQGDDKLSTPVQLFLQIGHRGESKIHVNHETVAVYGLDCFEHLKSRKMQALQVVDKLKLLSRTCEDVLKDASAEERVILEDMIPLGFATKSFLEDMELDDESQPPMKWKRFKKGCTSEMLTG